MRQYLIFCGDLVHGYIAPNQHEAIMQCREHIAQKAAISRIEEVRHKVSLYDEIETGKLLTEADVYQSYAENYPTREITFVGYLYNCAEKIRRI